MGAQQSIDGRVRTATSETSVPAAKGGKPARRERGRREPIERSAVIREALRIVDTQGLDALTVRSLAAAFDVYPTTIQWHVGSKAELLADVGALIVLEIELPNEKAMPPTEWLKKTCHAWRDSLLRHPNAASVATSQMVLRPEVLPVVERIVGVLETAGFDGEGLVLAYNTILGCLVGWTALELSSEPEKDDESWREEYAATLDSLSPISFPSLARQMPSMKNGAFMTRVESGRTRPLDASFTFMVELVCDAVVGRAAPRDPARPL